MEMVQDYPSWFVVICCTVFAVEGLVGFVFNLAVLVVYHLNQRTLKNVSNVLITNLNIIDMLICLLGCSISLVFISTSRFHDTLICYVHEASVAFASAASAVNLLVISFDRYESIVAPMKRKIKDKNVKYIVGFIWVLAMIAVLVPFCGYLELTLQNITARDLDSNKSTPCSYWLHQSKAYYVHELYYVAAFIISSLVTLVCYYRVFRMAKQRLAVRIALLKSTLTLPGSKPLMDIRRQQDKRVTTMTLVIVCTFIICWGPNMTITVIGFMLESSLSLEMAQTGLLCLAYLSTVLHPLLYAFMRKNFRQVLREKWRSRPLAKQTRISPVQWSPTNGVRLLAVQRSPEIMTNGIPAICKYLPPSNSITISTQRSVSQR